jgi:DNA sulfur modification protein DndE
VGRRIGVPTEDVLIEDCTVYRAHGGFTIGSEMSGGVRNIRVNNCTFIGTDIGLRFKTGRGRGGVVEKIYISNVRMLNIPGDAINFTMYYGGKAPLEDSGAATEASAHPVTVETPQFRDIHIQNIVCRGAKNAMMLQGLPELPIRGIALKDVSITSQQGIVLIDAEDISFENVRVDNASGEPIKTIRVKNSKLELSR